MSDFDMYNYPGFNIKFGQAAGGDLTGTFPNPTLAAGININTTGTIISTNTTDSTSTSTGAIKTSGGVGIAKSLFVGSVLSQAGGYAYLGSFNSATFPTAGSSVAINFNFSASQGEMSLFNTNTSATNVCFWFRQLTGASAQTPLLAICTDGGVFTGSSGVNTTSATGQPFFYLNTCAGAPTGTPAHAAAGLTAIVYDSTNHKIWFYDQPASAWKGVVVA